MLSSSKLAGTPAGILIYFLVFTTAWGAAAPAAFQSAEELKIVTLQGEGAVNDVKAKIATEPVVEVRDSHELPVVDAEVMFQMPAIGPGGVFADRSRTFKTKTNAQGQAAATGLVPNSEVGRYTIKVIATSMGRTGTATIAQSNSTELAIAREKNKRFRHWKLWALLGGAAVTGGILAATLAGGSSASPHIAITTGPVAVGGPR